MRRNFEQAIVDIDDIVEKLNHLYTHRDELRDLGRRCHAFAQQFDWSIPCKQFVDLLDSVIARPNESELALLPRAASTGPFE